MTATNDITYFRVQGVIASSGQTSAQVSAPVKTSPEASSGGPQGGTMTITTKSSQDLNSRLAASLSRWNAGQTTGSDEFKAKVSPDKQVKKLKGVYSSKLAT